MIPWWGSVLIGTASGAISGILGGVFGGWLRERILYGARRRWDLDVLRQEAPENLEAAAEYVV